LSPASPIQFFVRRPLGDLPAMPVTLIKAESSVVLSKFTDRFDKKIFEEKMKCACQELAKENLKISNAAS